MSNGLPESGSGFAGWLGLLAGADEDSDDPGTEDEPPEAGGAEAAFDETGELAADPAPPAELAVDVIPETAAVLVLLHAANTNEPDNAMTR